MIYVGSMGPGLLQSFHSFGRAVAGVTSAAGNLADAGANVTVAVTDAALSTISLAHSAAGEAWHGIDLLNVSIERDASTAVGRSSKELADWYAGGMDATVPADHAAWFAAVVRRVSPIIPVVLDSRELLTIAGRFSRVRAHARLRADGTVASVFFIISANFTPQWTNPLWETIGFSVSSSAARIVGEFQVIFNGLPPLESDRLCISDVCLKAQLGVGLGIMAWAPPQRFVLVVALILLGVMALRMGLSVVLNHWYSVCNVVKTFLRACIESFRRFADALAVADSLDDDDSLQQFEVVTASAHANEVQ